NTSLCTIVLPSCGNGAIDAGETCDDSNTLSGDGCDSACQTEFCGDGTVQTAFEMCDDGNTANGDGCSGLCTLEIIPPACGNGAINPGESCDGINFNGLLCNNFDAFTGGSLSCTSACTVNTSSCTGGPNPTGVCGDGFINNGEACDGVQWGTITGCLNFGFTGGTLTCNSNCNFNTSLCTISGANVPPVANASVDQTVLEGSLVTLDGSFSYDPDNSPVVPITYNWTQVSGPVIVTLTNPLTANPTFTATVAGTYVFRLVVFDGAAYSTADSVTIIVNTIAQSITTGFGLYNSSGNQVTTITAGQPLYALLSIGNQFNYNINGITSTLNPAGMPIMTNTDSNTNPVINTNLPAIGAGTVWWQLNTASMSGPYTITVNTEGIIDSRNIQVN
ncbi:MAG: DUF4215 domain-containing protein, partial [Nanoarchaeota archaeon]|nr:DUF4215 domain-containing protein [Nanoarchaeota archaeon]